MICMTGPHDFHGELSLIIRMVIHQFLVFFFYRESRRSGFGRHKIMMLKFITPFWLFGEARDIFAFLSSFPVSSLHQIAIIADIGTMDILLVECLFT
jgi:hypothetical protein